MEKRGQQMTLSTIIIIVLGIAVLVFLIFGFSTGWNNLWNRVTNLGGGSANVDTIAQACSIACTSNSVDAFCRQSRTVNYGQNVNVTIDGVVKSQASASGTCNNFLKNSSAYGGIRIDPCSVSCA